MTRSRRSMLGCVAWSHGPVLPVSVTRPPPTAAHRVRRRQPEGIDDEAAAAYGRHRAAGARVVRRQFGAGRQIAQGAPGMCSSPPTWKMDNCSRRVWSMPGRAGSCSAHPGVWSPRRFRLEAGPLRQASICGRCLQARPHRAGMVDSVPAGSTPGRVRVAGHVRALSPGGGVERACALMLWRAAKRRWASSMARRPGRAAGARAGHVSGRLPPASSIPQARGREQAPACHPFPALAAGTRGTRDLPQPRAQPR